MKHVMLLFFGGGGVEAVQMWRVCRMKVEGHRLGGP